MAGFAVVNPIEDSIGPKSLAGVTEKLKLKGVVLYCSRGAYHPAHSRAMRFYECVRDLRLPIFFHNFAEGPQAVLEYAQPHLIDEVAREFPEIKIVIGNMGIPFFQQTIWMVSKHKNVFADLTIRPGKVWQVFNIVTAAHEQGVMDKLIFGSGYPAAAPGDCMEALLGFNKLMAEAKLPVVPRGSIRNIIDRNTLEVLGIDHPAASSGKPENLD
jgi:predicted TIM-barrel fold metal-dependent hydrolase